MERVSISDLKPITNESQTSFLYEIVGLTGAIEYSQISIAKTVLIPGAVVSKHYHKLSEEVYFFTAGEGTMVIDQQSFIVKDGDLVFISPNECHELNVKGDDDLEFIAITIPAYTPEDYFAV